MKKSRNSRDFSGRNGGGTSSSSTPRSRIGGRGLLGSWAAGNARSQRVVVKIRVVRNRGKGGGKTLPRHVDYLERDGVDEDGSQGKSFGDEGILGPDEVREFVARSDGDRHHFRIILTPERGADLDLRDYTQAVVSQMEFDLGTKLDWLAVEHHNTGHPHAHVLIRGVDERGADLVMNRSYISEGIRERARAIATQTLGLRTDRELSAERERDVIAERLTYLDRRMIGEAARGAGLVDARPPLRPEAGFRAELREQSVRRLAQLRSLGLAEELAPGQWKLAPNLAKELQARSRNADLVRELREVVGPRFRFRDIAVYSKDSPPESRVTGEVIDRRRVDDISETDRLLVAATDGKVYRIALSLYSERPGQTSRVGDIVRISVSHRPTISNADRNVVRLAAENEGVYDAETHRSFAKRSPTVGPNVDIAEYVGNHVKRLEGLERRGLVTRIDAERFRIPETLLEQLASNSPGRDAGIVGVERLSPFSLREQVRAVGPTWLDREIAARLTELLTGRARESTAERRLFAAARARIARLKDRGMLGASLAESRVTAAVLDRLYGEEIAMRSRALEPVYGPRIEATSRITGRVARVEELSSGTHAVIVNEQGFVVVPANAALARQQGRNVELSLERSRGLAMERKVRVVAMDVPGRTRSLER